MNEHDVDRLLATWLTAHAPTRPPDGLIERVLEQTGRTRRRPRWRIREGWLPMQLTLRQQAAPRYLPVLLLVALLVALLVVALLVAALGIGGPRPLPSPFGLAGNGRVAYSSGGQIWTAAPDGSGPRAVVTSVGAAAGIPAWSRDGTRIAFLEVTVPTTASDPGLATLAVVAADGSDSITIDADAPFLRYVSWSPDGTSLAYSKWIAYAGQRDRIFVAASDGSSAPRQIGDRDLSAYNAAFSPDGSKIAFVSDHGRQYGLHVMAGDGSDVTEPTHGLYPGAGVATGSGRSTSWSPDGAWLVYAAGDDQDVGLYAVPVDGSVLPRRLADGDGTETNGAWSPAGDEIAFIRFANGRRDALLIRADGTGERPIATNVASFDPQWSPDGRWVAVVDADSGTGHGSMRLIRVDGAHPTS